MKIESDNQFSVLLSIVVPALDEQDNVSPLVEQVKAAVIDAGIAGELLVVDDGSTDQTLAKLNELAKQYAWLRPLHRPSPKGQSAAMLAGIAAARGQFIATLDADLQNDPADLPKMLDVIKNENADLAQGDRTHDRQDTFVRKVTSWVGRTTRRLLLADTVRDTGCSTRVMRASFAKQLPLQFKGMHRFVPIYIHMLGGKIVQVPANHRPRIAGQAKYGISNRAVVGFFDCLAMRWMLKRYRDASVTETREEGAK